MFFGENRITPLKDRCCGCGACEQICAKHAITMRRDEEGFMYPVLDGSLCVECGLCETVCPMRHADCAKAAQGKPYLAVNRDGKTLWQSSSGGIFSIIADWVLEKGGIVYGAAFDGHMMLRHVGVEDAQALSELRGSKYLQSDGCDVYTQIRNQLKNGRWVYYTGTGCQVAGLRLFLRKPYPNLICSDLICHGTPSQKVFDWVVSEMERKYNGKIVKYQFRDKKVNGWSCSSSSSSLRIGDKIKYVGYDPIMMAYFNAFISGTMNREACYTCPCTTVERTGDITLSDYWGVKKYHKVENAYNGVSAILVNTEKGMSLLSELRDKMDLKETKIEWIADENKNLIQRTARPETRTSFYEELGKDPQMLMRKYQPTNLLRSYVVFQIKRLCRKNRLLYSVLLKAQELRRK